MADAPWAQCAGNAPRGGRCASGRAKARNSDVLSVAPEPTQRSAVCGSLLGFLLRPAQWEKVAPSRSEALRSATGQRPALSAEIIGWRQSVFACKNGKEADPYSDAAAGTRAKTRRQPAKSMLPANFPVRGSGPDSPADSLRSAPEVETSRQNEASGVWSACTIGSCTVWGTQIPARERNAAHGRARKFGHGIPGRGAQYAERKRMQSRQLGARKQGHAGVRKACRSRSRRACTVTIWRAETRRRLRGSP